MRSWRALLAVALVLGMSMVAQGQSSSGNYQCRMAGAAANSGCGLPFALSNFQGNYPCNSNVKVGRPATVSELQTIVANYDHVRANGVGGSWNPDQFCSGNDSSAVNIVMTELSTTLDAILNPPDPTTMATLPDDFPILVNETLQTVDVSAGVPQRVLLNYLAKYKNGAEPMGWTLPAFSWFIDQTIGGAVSTGTHGSTMRYGSLSSQVLSMDVVLANGTLAVFTPEKDPHLFKALGVSAGRLGVITKLKMRIVPQKSVRKTSKSLRISEFAEQVAKVEQAYNAAKNNSDTAAMQQALYQLHETQVFWNVELGTVSRIDFNYLDRSPSDVLPNLNFSMDPSISAYSVDSGVFNQVKKTPVSANTAMLINPTAWGQFYATSFEPYTRSGTFSSRDAFMSVTELTSSLMTTFAPYTQMEVSIPMEKAGYCLATVGAQIYGSDALWQGFRNVALVRFVSGEPFYLSNTNGGPRMYINLEDYLTLSGSNNTKFNTVMELFRTKCDARLHWGKGGWPLFAKCFDGAKEYPDSWCDFGCAAQTLDPTGKFAGTGVGIKKVWQWNATRDGQEVPFGSCCTAEGFSSECQCAPRSSCS